MAKNNKFGEVTGDLKPLVAKVQAMTDLANAGKLASHVGASGLIKGDAEEALKAICLGIHMMCEDLAEDINNLAKSIRENGVGADKEEKKNDEEEEKDLNDLLGEILNKLKEE